jgi:hypothetical protein
MVPVQILPKLLFLDGPQRGITGERCERGPGVSGALLARRTLDVNVRRLVVVGVNKDLQAVILWKGSHDSHRRVVRSSTKYTGTYALD